MTTCIFFIIPVYLQSVQVYSVNWLKEVDECLGEGRDLHIPLAKEVIQRLSSQYSARLNSHPNLLTANLKKQPSNRRLQRTLPTDLPTSFLV
jgi:hypothetical protein